MKLFPKIHLCYVVLVCLLFILFRRYFRKKGMNQKILNLISLGYFLVTIFTFSYFNGVFFQIFQLKYLSVKSYLFVVAVVNFIAFYTMNHKIKVGYSVLNYCLFIMITIIFGAVISIVIGNQFQIFYVMDISNAVNFVDLSLVLFIFYLILFSITFIGYDWFTVSEIQDNSKQFSLRNINMPKISIKKRKKKQKKVLKDDVVLEEQGYLEAILNHQKGEKFYIHDVDCSIIFEDSVEENILKNYSILQKDIHAKLVNGYTLEENKMLRDICMKLNINNLGIIDIDNISLLNRISVEEYNLLKKVFDVQ